MGREHGRSAVITECMPGAWPGFLGDPVSSVSWGVSVLRPPSRIYRMYRLSIYFSRGGTEGSSYSNTYSFILIYFYSVHAGIWEVCQ